VRRYVLSLDAQVLSGQKVIEVEGGKIPVRLEVQHLSFSAHADAKGIMQLIKQCDAKNVVLVHGEKKKMGFLSNKIKKELGVDCFFPANGAVLSCQPLSGRLRPSSPPRALTVRFNWPRSCWFCVVLPFHQAKTLRSRRRRPSRSRCPRP